MLGVLGDPCGRNVLLQLNIFSLMLQKSYDIHIFLYTNMVHTLRIHPVTQHRILNTQPDIILAFLLSCVSHATAECCIFAVVKFQNCHHLTERK